MNQPAAVAGSVAEQPRPARRRTPLRSTCAQPHPCARPVRLRVLQQVPYFAGLPEPVLDAVDRRMVALSWAAGDPLYRAGDPAEHLFVVAAGRVKLTRPTAGGGEVITDLLAPGGLLGALSTLGQPTHAETARALTTTCALRISQDDFRAVLTEHPAVALRVLDDVAARLAAAHAGAEEATGSVPRRVAATLLRLADRLGQDRGSGGTLLQLPLTRADLAAMTGSTPESVSRAMSRWRRDGIIDSGRRWTAVLDRARLAEIVAGD
ncbi:Crp/Fnr family transcriptional regulator [Georgenia sp. TF02-10]|uniref:Crp/Fnr family transcriptional regulator n=1 Tax=Georgenia sp. TF02-10 TaxID=2917725 RepID=UPI001FA6D549|nr:Crp/Fnr family transcriptional regulator [Georgenia sp. TF02-10]UNX54652.1 Crp/Fnr family transcriptional regulator [Georgenia sp. TF02-10]